MSFQFVFDNAAQLRINRRPIVGQTITRSNVVRSAARGTAVWQFEVTLPTGPRWSDYRSAITLIESLNQTVIDTVSISNPGHSWLIGYQGDLANPNLVQVNSNTGVGDTVEIVSTPTITSGFIFKSGDVIQLGATGKCYTVVNDVAWNQTVIKLHRPKLNEINQVSTLRVAENCEWKVICTQFPNWNLFERNQVSWDGGFVFIETDLIPGA